MIFNFFKRNKKWTVEEYEKLEKSFDTTNDELADLAIEFNIRKKLQAEIMKSTSDMEVLKSNNERFEHFRKSHLKSIGKIKKERDRLKKAIDSLNENENFQEVLKERKQEKAQRSILSLYRNGEISLKACDNLLKAKTGEPVKYSDILIFNEKGQLLLLKRSELDKTGAGLFVVPGGHVDPGEDFETAALRELEEETGIILEKLSRVAVYKTDKVHIEYFERNVEFIEPILDEEEAWNYEWVEVDKLDDYEFPFNMKENLKQIICNSSPNPEVKELKDTNKTKNKINKAFEDNQINEKQRDLLLKAVLDNIEKGGKPAVIGEIRTWANGQRYRKEAKGWVNVKTEKSRREEIAEIDDTWLEPYREKNLDRLPIGVEESDVKKGTDKNNWELSWVDPTSGKRQYAYTREFLKKNADKKWERIKDISQKQINNIKNKTTKDISSGNEAAAIVNIIANTGLRIGSRTGFSKTENKGVSTLSPKNIKISGNKIKFSFTGKSYHNNTAEFKSKELVEFLTKLKEERKGEEFIFKATDNDVRDYFKTVDDSLLLKDMRTYVATNMAENILKNDKIPPPPIPEKGLKKAIQQKLMKVFKEVSEQLNNTPTMAKTSYIHPKVIDRWLEEIGVDKSILA